MAHKITALESLKKGLREYQQFCSRFPDHNRNFRLRFEVSKNHTHFMLNEIQDFVKAEYEPQIAKLRTLITEAYNSIELPTIAGYSEPELLKCISAFAEKPFSFGSEKQKIIQQILNGIDVIPVTAERAFAQNKKAHSISSISPQADKDEIQRQMLKF